MSMMTSAEAYAERLAAASMSTYETFSTYAGLTLGWFAALAEGGPATSTELAARTGTQERYCREFCEFQASMGTLTADDTDDPQTRRFTLPAGPAEVLLDTASLNYVGPLAQMAVAAGRRIDDLLTAYRDGGGVSWAEFGHDAREAQAALNRPWFTQRLAPALAGVPELHAVLSRPGARILDVGCGGGWSTLALAVAYPDATVVGVDIDAPSIEAARTSADAAGLGDRVEFVLTEGEALPESDPYDAAFAFECLHDMPRPVEVLAAIRSAVRPDGAVVIMDEAVADEFTAPGTEVDQCMYGFSLFICLPDGLTSAPSAATGTVMRRPVLTDYARRAGFAEVTVLPIDDFGFFRFYRLS
jgi:SAM-dependent methyltransferase